MPSSSSPLPLLPPRYEPDTDYATSSGAGKPVPPDVNSCSTVEQLHLALSHLNARESAATARLQGLLARQSNLSHELSRLDLIRAHLGTQVVTARSLSNNVLSGAATAALRVSSAVKRLDVEQSRVKSTLEVVEQVAELKACVLGVTGSMGAPQDWETAAGYLHRASKIPREIIIGEFAEEMVPSAEVPDPPAVTLENAAESLCGLFLREFEKAAANADGEKVTRFFKLFPLIGRAQTGLEVYGKYVCEGVARRARERLSFPRKEDDGFYYANAIISLFEHLANIVEQHGALVDRHYGTSRMVKVVERLQVEADMQGGIIIDTFTDERNIDRKLTDIRSYAFSFLVQSFLGGPRASSGTPRTSSPAPGGAPNAQDTDGDGMDTKDIDMLLTEMGIMLSRWSMYCRFLALKYPADPAGPLQLPPIILTSALTQKIENRLIGPFNAMTTFFCRRSVEKAFQIDEAPTDLSLSLSSPPSRYSHAPYTTSAVEDVMFIVKKLLQRALETSQRALAGSVVSTVGRVLSSDFVGMIQRKMRDETYPKSATAGTPPPDEKVLAFMVLINNLDTAAEYTHRIIQGFLDPVAAESGYRPLEELFCFDGEAAYVRDALVTMGNSFEQKTQELVADAINILFKQVIMPRLRPLLADAFREIDYLPPSDDPGSGAVAGDDDREAGAGELVKNRFAEGWNGLMTPLQRILTEKSFNKLLFATARYFSSMLEKRIWACAGRVNELGAIRLQRDVAGVVGVVVRGGRYGVRDMFVRCTQICLVLALEEDELEGVFEENGEDDGMEWKLTVDERRRAREMVVRR